MSWAQRDRTLQETFTFMDKEPKSLFSLNEERYVSKEVTENAIASEGKSCRPETNRRKSIWVSQLLSMKQAAKIMHIHRNLHSIIYPLDKKFIGTSSILIFHSRSARPPICLFFEYNSQCPLLFPHLFPPHHRMFQWLGLLPYPRDGLLPHLNLPFVHRLVRRGIWYFQFSSKKWKHMWCALVLFGFDLCHLQTTSAPITHLLWSQSNQNIWNTRHLQGTNQQNIQILDVLV